MMETYQGILRDNHIEWVGDAPAALPRDLGVRVHVTLLETVVPPASETSRGEQMAAVLERLAAARAFGAMTDPAAWEREERRDRPLPGREE